MAMRTMTVIQLKMVSDKCGIIKRDCAVISSVQTDEALAVIQQAAQMQQAVLSVFERDFRLEEYSSNVLTYKDSSRTIDHLRLAVMEFYQRENAAVAIRAALTVDPELTADNIRKGLAAYLPPARQQLLPGMPLVIVDVPKPKVE